MSSFARLSHATLVTATLFALTAPAAAQKHKELGRMWTFENAPLEWFEQEYGFRPAQEWLDALRAASVRYGNGCSASFVSPNGLIITNNHCAQENVGQVNPPNADWVVDGIFMSSLEQEVRIPDLTVQNVVATRNVTAEMNEGLTEDMDAAARQSKLRDNRIALTKAAADANPELTHELVTLYQGGMYQLYSYKIYDDIRLVCAPPKNVAEFGGDPDNFTYPRFCLDFALLRAWEDGKPADTSAHYLKFKTSGPSEGDAVFVSGNPGSTGRLNTIAQMEFLRDVQYPQVLDRIDNGLSQVRTAMDASAEKAKELRPRLLMFENAKKAYGGYLAGLKNPNVMGIKRNAEKQMRDAIRSNAAWSEKFGDPWADIEALMEEKRTKFTENGGRVPPEIAQREQDLAKRVGEAAFAIYGTDIPPDATLSIRISDGRVKGYPYNGTLAPWTTTLYGMYARHHEFDGKDPFDLPQEWKDRVGKIDLKTRANFVTTCDIIGGNSGSPLVDTQRNFVGLVFDGNIESLGNRFVFTDDVPRTICVHPQYIITALRDVYDRGMIADELEGKSNGYVK